MSDVIIVDAEGLTFNAQLEPAAANTAPDTATNIAPNTAPDTGEAQTLLRLTDGSQFLVPTELLTRRPDGRYDLHLKLREYAVPIDSANIIQADSADGVPADASPVQAAQPGDTVVPVVEERLRVGKRTVQNRVQLHKYVTERTETADVPLFQERVEIERVKHNRLVDEAAPVRYEGDTVIVPLYEEVLVVSKELRLVEEVRITTERSEHHDPQEVTLRREEVEVKRAEGESDGKLDNQADGVDGKSDNQADSE